MKEHLRAMLHDTQKASVRLEIGRHARYEASVKVTPAGILAIGALVSAILLSVPPIITAARTLRDHGDRDDG